MRTWPWIIRGCHFEETSMNVILNRWQGGALAYPRCTCWSCGQAATVVEFAHHPDGGLLARICGACLDRARDALNAAILADSVETASGA